MDPSEIIDDQNVNGVANSLNGDEVVISGISGIFPNSESVLDFMDNLYNKVDMVLSDGPKQLLKDPDFPKYSGKIKGTDKFDAQFFGVNFNLSCVLEPMGRKLLEHAYGAIFDSGTNLQSIRGKKVGVFVGSAFTDNGSLAMYNIGKRSDFIINGGSKAMLANRISYWMDAKGPSYGLDYADSSSTACLEQAYRAIKSGECEAAVVAGCNYGIHPQITLNLRRAGLLCLDGKTKCFDKNADGYVRADAINVIFLQRARDAHRIYCQVYHAKGNYKLRPDAEFLPLRETEDIEEFLNEFYSETDLDPKEVEYVEGHGAGIAKADANELSAISNIFAKNSSVKVGSVKSNMGNSEPAAGICSVTKLCLAYHKGILAANLHYNEPQDQIPAVRDGTLQVVSEHASFDRGFTALNNFSFTGANFHVVLKGHYKEKNIEKYKCQIPRLLLASGREESCVHKVIDIVKSHPLDPEEIALLHKIYETDIPGHTGRGYALLDTNENNETVTVSESVEYYPGVKRPLWFVYSGMGSQWAGMAADLMRIPTFAAAIHKCHKVLESKGIDLIRIVTEPDNSIFDNTLYAFVGIGAVQIGLTDVIKEIGIVPDSIIGHSLGEMACAYHDNTFTAEELILSTYSRGKAVFDSPKVKGSMAAVGLGYHAIMNQVPPEIDIACHNSSESSTISGPADKMKEFVGELTKRGVFAREVPCGGIAYHSRYIAHCGPELLRRLSAILKNPKKRSSKWISTSVPQDRWDEPAAVYSSAEYHTNNLLKPVLFEEMSKLIPDNAIVVEIAPHGLLQAILKRSHKDCTHIPLTRRGNPDGVKFLLEAIGKIYQAGVNPKVDVLYPKIEFPVSTATPLLSHLIEWEHSETWPELSFSEKEELQTATARHFVMSIHDDDYNYLEGHVRNGMNVLPESAALVLAWETLSMHIGANYRNQSVIFRDIQFHSEVIIRPDIPLRLSISITRGNNRFEVRGHIFMKIADEAEKFLCGYGICIPDSGSVSQDDTCIASGIMSTVKVIKYKREVEKPYTDDFEEEIILNSEDVYKILKSRGYSYKGKFKSIQQSNLDRNEAYIEWNKDWVTFLDSLIQFNTIAREHDGISTPKFIRKLRISIPEHSIAKVVDANGVSCYTAQYDSESGIIRCAGVELDNVTFVDKPVVQRQPDVLLSRAFYPHYAMDKVDLKTALQINLQIVSENTTRHEIKVTQVVESNKNISCIINELTHNIPNVRVNVASVLNISKDYETLLIQNSDVAKANVFIIENLLGDKQKLESLRNLSKDSFVLALETGVPKLQGLTKQHFSVVSAMSDGKQILILLKRQNLKDVTYIRVNCDNKLDWMSRVYDELNKTKRVVLVSEKQPYCGALGFVNKLRKDGEEKIALVAIDDFHAPKFDPEHIVYQEQLEKNLTINILKKGQWGGYYYEPAVTSTKIQNVTLNSTTPGDMDSLAWNEAPAIPSSSNLVQVSYAGISLKDVKKAVGNNSSEEISFGMDYSGIDSDGDRVMGLVPGGALSSTVEADPTLLWPVPEHWSLQDAATVPLPFSMAYYCLFIRCQLVERQSVLITGGSGALGQAIIALCLSLGCTVFTTVSSEHKKKILLRSFPQLDENKIGHSRNESFLSMIKTQTGGERCNFVINCTSGHLRELAMKCVGGKGFFVDLSSYDMTENNGFGMSFLAEEKSYTAVNFSSIFRPENINNKKDIQRMLSEGIAKGVVRPISRVEYSPTAISRAFRLLSSSKHVGKVLIRMRSPEIMNQGFKVTRRMTYCSKGVHIVICDENGLGIELADRLIRRGVRKIVLHLRSKVSGYLHTKFVTWQKYGVSIKISSDKLQTQDGCIKLLKEAARIGSVKGIFILQVSENDENAQDIVQKFNKAAAVVNLDLVSRNYCNELSHFVLLATSSRHAGEEFALSVSERVCRARSEIGAPALVVHANGLIGQPNEYSNATQTLSEFFNAMENGLKLKYNSILSYNLERVQDSDYLEKVAKILGVPKIENIPSETIVHDLKLNDSNLEELQTLIRNVCGVDYPIQKIQHLTIVSLQSITTETTNDSTPHEGLGAFYTSVDVEEEHMAVLHPIIPMTTLLNNGPENNLDPSETYLTMLPGFGGRHQVFNSMTERLKVKAVAVQLPYDMEGNSFPEMAATVRKFMKTKFEIKSKFYLLGYSFGVNVALELADLLEKEGHIGVVYCLDSSPDALKTQLNSHIGYSTGSKLQNAVLRHIYSLITGHHPEELQHDFEKIETWMDKVEFCIKRMTGLANYSKQYQRSILEGAYNRVLLAREYEPHIKLESQLVLMRGIPHPSSEGLSEDYNLSKYTKQPVRVFHIESDHTSAPYDCRVSNIVNKLLDTKLLEEFQNKNLCDKYKLKSK